MGMTDAEGAALFTVEEACEYLDVSRATVYRLMDRGVLTKKKFPHVRLPYISLEELEQYKASRGLTLEEMAIRLVTLERQVNFLMHQSSTPKNTHKPKATKETVNHDGVMRALKKNHPEIFSD